MDKPCIICCKSSKYKCPKCYSYYCSTGCCKEHKNNNCKEKVHNTNRNEEICREKKEASNRYDIAKEKLQLLGNNEEIKELLNNKYLRDLLVVIDQAEDAEKIMQEAMQEPIFVEFADACLKVMNPAEEQI